MVDPNANRMPKESPPRDPDVWDSPPPLKPVKSNQYRSDVNSGPVRGGPSRWNAGRNMGGGGGANRPAGSAQGSRPGAGGNKDKNNGRNYDKPWLVNNKKEEKGAGNGNGEPGSFL